MLIRFAQIIIPTQDPIPADTTNPNFSYDKGGNIAGEGGDLPQINTKDIKGKIESSLANLDPKIKQTFQSEYNQIINNRSENEYQPLIKLFQNITNEIKKQEVISFQTVKDLGSKINYMFYEKGQDSFDELGKIFQNYLKYEMSDEFLSKINLGDDLKEIARFFVNQSSDPKFDKVKQIFKRIPANKWAEITDLVVIALCFYLDAQLNKMVSILEKRSPQTFSDTTAISLINSKMALNSMKIGVSLNNLINNNMFGKLLGQLASTAIYGVEKLQDYTNTNKSIGDLINSNPTTRVK
jgi:hypothetical protein